MDSHEAEMAELRVELLDVVDAAADLLDDPLPQLAADERQRPADLAFGHPMVAAELLVGGLRRGGIAKVVGLEERPFGAPAAREEFLLQRLDRGLQHALEPGAVELRLGLGSDGEVLRAGGGAV